MFSNQDIIRIAMRQSALDLGCDEEDFLKEEDVLERDKIPFYCCAWSNVRSARNAVKCGFSPAWVEMTVKPEKVVDEMNQ